MAQCPCYLFTTITNCDSVCRGVFQTLVEKHFPAPDRRKTFDIFGLGNYGKKKEPVQQTENNKRKKGIDICNKDKSLLVQASLFGTSFGKEHESVSLTCNITGIILRST